MRVHREVTLPIMIIIKRVLFTLPFQYFHPHFMRNIEDMKYDLEIDNNLLLYIESEKNHFDPLTYTQTRYVVIHMLYIDGVYFILDFLSA